MKVLYFTFIKPSEHFGGGIVVLQSLASLSSFAEIHYVGLDYDEKEFDKYSIKIKKKTILEPDGNILSKMKNLLLAGTASSFYASWNQSIRNIKPEDYDFVYMDFTRQDFVAKWAKKYRIPCILRAHNVEADYFKSMYIKEKSFINYLHLKLAYKAEFNCIKNATKVIALTKSDKSRLIKLYGQYNEKFDIIPVCVLDFEMSQQYCDKPYVLLTGSLWFGPNAEGIEWFLTNVWSEIDQLPDIDYELVIAGARPNEKIKQLSKKYEHIKLFDSPESIDGFYAHASIYVAPIFYGAGMKVKIAEALSCGLPVITTSHAYSGYEKIKHGISVGDDKDFFISNILKLMLRTDKESVSDSKLIRSEFKKNLSMDFSKVRLEAIIRGILEAK